MTIPLLLEFITIVLNVLKKEGMQKPNVVWIISFFFFFSSVVYCAKVEIPILHIAICEVTMGGVVVV